MIPDIDYLKAKSVNEALKALAQPAIKAKILAGGTDIIPGFHIRSRRFQSIDLLVDISELPELKNVAWYDDGLHIGSAVTFSTLVNTPLIVREYPLLAKAAAQIGSVQIRNRATLAGNFVNNAPCADSVPPLLVYEAQIVIRSLENERRLPLSDFLMKPYHTQLQKEELVTEIILPRNSIPFQGKFYKLGRRRAVAISRITLAVLLYTQGHTIEEIRVAAGAITPVGKRFRELETWARGQEANPDFWKTLTLKLGQQILEVTGLRWSSDYKLPVLQQTFYNVLRSLSETAL